MKKICKLNENTKSPLFSMKNYKKSTKTAKNWENFIFSTQITNFYGIFSNIHTKSNAKQCFTGILINSDERIWKIFRKNKKFQKLGFSAEFRDFCGIFMENLTNNDEKIEIRIVFHWFWQEKAKKSVEKQGKSEKFEKIRIFSKTFWLP